MKGSHLVVVTRRIQKSLVATVPTAAVVVQEMAGQKCETPDTPRQLAHLDHCSATTLSPDSCGRSFNLAFPFVLRSQSCIFHFSASTHTPKFPSILMPSPSRRAPRVRLKRCPLCPCRLALVTQDVRLDGGGEIGKQINSLIVNVHFVISVIQWWS